MLTDSPLMLRRFIVVGLCLTLLSGCGADPQPALDQANDLLFQQNYVEAERLYRKLLKQLESQAPLSDSQKEHHLLILGRLGRINSLYLRDYTQSITDYSVLVQNYPKTEDAFAARATVADIYHHKLGKHQAALDEFQKLVSQFPGKARSQWAQLQIITIYLQLKNYEQARTEAEALVKLWPASDEARQAQFLIANSYYIQGRHTEAIATYTQILNQDADPEFKALIHFELANCYQSLGDEKRALDHYYTCLADHPNPLLVQRKLRKTRGRLTVNAQKPRIHRATPTHRYASRSPAPKKARAPRPAPPKPEPKPEVQPAPPPEAQLDPEPLATPETTPEATPEAAPEPEQESSTTLTPPNPEPKPEPDPVPQIVF
jgi:tetratricopeptide (TPR) repeat protein